MNMKSALRENQVVCTGGLKIHEEKFYQQLKRDHLFSIDEEGERSKVFESEIESIIEIPKYSEKVRTMRRAGAVRRRNLSTPKTKETISMDVSNLKSLAAPRFDLPRHFRENNLSRTTCAPQTIDFEVTKSHASFIDQIFGIMEDEDIDICEDEETDDEEYADEVIVEWEVPLKEDNFDAHKRCNLSRGDKRKEELLLDSAWDFDFNNTRVLSGEDTLSVDEESADTGDGNECHCVGNVDVIDS